MSMTREEALEEDLREAGKLCSECGARLNIWPGTRTSPEEISCSEGCFEWQEGWGYTVKDEEE